MRTRDLAALGLLCALILALAPAWADPRAAAANFGDLYAYHYPMRHLAASALAAGRLPFWNPYIFSGLPLAANPQSVLFYPLAALGRVLPLGLSLSWDFAFHLLWAAAGAFLLARRLRAGTLGAALLAGLYALSPFLVYRVEEGIPTLLAALSWVPWCWLAWLSERAALLAAVWSLQFLSGHPQFMVVNALGMAAFAALEPRRARLFRSLGLAGAATLALTAAQWLPLREFLSRSVRSGWPPVYTTAYSIDAGALASWLYPDAWGNPVDGSYAGPPSVFFETGGVFLGVLGLALAAWGLSRRGRRAPLVLIGAGLFLACGGRNPLYRLLLAGPAGWLRTPSRYGLLCLWGLWLAAGRGWRAVETVLEPASAVKALALCAALLELAVWDARFLRRQDPGPFLAPNAAVAAAIGGRPFRVMTDPGLASPNKTMLYRAMNVNGYEAFYLAGYPEYAARSEGRAAADASRTYLSRWGSPEMRRLGVRAFLRADGALIDAPGALPLAFFADEAGRPLPSNVDVGLEGPERWSAEGRAPAGAAVFVAAQPLYPGWRARLGGRSAALSPWDGWLSAARLPADLRAGEPLRLELYFEPTLWPLWAAASALAWAVWLALWPARLAAEGARA